MYLYIFEWNILLVIYLLTVSFTLKPSLNEDYTTNTIKLHLSFMFNFSLNQNIYY